MSKRDIFINLVTKADKKGLDDAEKGLAGLGKQAEKSGGLLGALTSRIGTFGDNVGKNLTGKLGAAGDAADNLGLGFDKMSGATAAAATGIVAFGAFVAGGVTKMKALYDQTRDFNEVAGTSWEEGSRLIAVFDDLRVSSDEGASAMGKLTKIVGTTPQVLDQFGISIAHAKDGSVDMAGTLENVATAFANTSDPAKRAALGSALFGKSWQNMVPVLNQGGDALKKLVDGVDKHQVATAAGAAEQDKLFEATDNLHDAIDGLQRALAQDAIPRLIELAEWSTKAVSGFSALNDKIPLIDAATKALPGPGFLSHTKDAVGELAGIFGHAGDNVGKLGETLDEYVAGASPAAKATEALAAGAREASAAMEAQKRRTSEAKDEYKAFTQATKDLLAAQEDQRDAQLALEDTTLALEQAEARAVDASNAAAGAVEDHAGALRDARGAMNEAAAAAVNNAEKQAEAAGTTLTASEKTRVYRDELIRLRDSVNDPDLAAALDAQIDRLAATAAQAQSAAANLRGLNRAMAEAAGIEANYTGTDSSGVAVTRRASGGPVWPGRTYLVGENGPELMRFDGTGPGEVLSNPQSQQTGAWPLLSGKGKASSPTVTYGADGSVQFAGDATTYAPGTVVTPGMPVRLPKVAVRPLGLGDDVSSGSGVTFGGYGGGGGGGVFNISVVVNNAIIGNRQELGDYLTKILDDYARSRL